jgi:hypothetical protein
MLINQPDDFNNNILLTFMHHNGRTLILLLLVLVRQLQIVNFHQLEQSEEDFSELQIDRSSVLVRLIKDSLGDDVSVVRGVIDDVLFEVFCWKF